MSTRRNVAFDTCITAILSATQYACPMRKETRYYSIERDRIEAVSRLIAASVVAAIVWWTHASGVTGAALEHTLMQYGVFLYVVGAAAVGIDLWLRPTLSISRNFLAIALDVTGVSAGLYLGAGTVDPIALFYLWIMLGSGMVYGVRYLYVASGLALCGFAFVYTASAYWQSHAMLSATVAGLMLFLGPYMATLLTSLERTRRLVTWQADHDGLTGLLNRRAFERELAGTISSVPSRNAHFLLYMDLDKFKEINDGAGHAAGDQALIEVVRLFATRASADDLLARMGGDEFCLLLTDQSLEQARRRAERIRNDVASYRLAWGTSYYTLGVSVGVASSESVADGQALIRLADAACYASKNNGRNQVHVVDINQEQSDTQVIRQLRLPQTSGEVPNPASVTNIA